MIPRPLRRQSFRTFHAIAVAMSFSVTFRALVFVSRHYSNQGDGAEIAIVAFNAGLHMLRADTSPVQPRLKSFKQSMPNVSFMACENTLEAMTRNEGKEPPLVENAERVKAGVVTLIELGEKGWTIVRP